MGERPSRRLRHTLFLIFLGFAAVPSLLLAGLAYRTLDASLDFWRTPAVSRALEGSLGVARQLLADRRASLDTELNSLLSREHRGAVAADSLRVALASSSFDAIGISTAASPGRIHWVSKLGHVVFDPTLDRRIAALPRDTLVVAGPEHLALIRVSGARRWVTLSPLSASLRSQLSDILKAQALYDELGDYRTVARRGLLLASAGTLMLVIVLSWVGAWALAPRVTRPLEVLAQAMAALSRGEEPPAVPAGEGEVGELARAFESMRHDLEVSRRDLARAEREAAWREVARRIAHEIKNPLTPIRLAVHRLRSLEPQLGEEERTRLAQSLDSVDREVETLRAMADTFSRFSRLPEPERRPTPVVPLVRSVSEMYQGSDLRLDWSVPDDLAASLDEGQLRQALHNLIQNAADAMAGCGRVAIRVTEERRAGRNGVCFEVTDQGPGFGPQALQHAGEPYFTEKTHGTGLGLAMVRRIAEGHGGQLLLGNATPRGGRVEFWIPQDDSEEERA